MRYTSAAIVALGVFAASPVSAQNPYAKADESWISISGTAIAPSADSFMLDYGDGVITVEMDDWAAYGDAHALLEGDAVTVYGEIDDGLFETAKIEASSVYIDSLNTYYYASSADEEGDATAHWVDHDAAAMHGSALIGTVTNVDPNMQTFTLDTGLQTMTVETDELGYNPLDEFGYQDIEKGDRVSVSGTIDREFFDGRVFNAETVVTLWDESRQS